MNLAQATAQRTKELLFKNNMTQYRLIKESCLDKTTQSLFKNKTKDIKLSTIFAIASVFNMSLSEFFNVAYFDNNEIDQL